MIAAWIEFGGLVHLAVFAIVALIVLALAPGRPSDTPETWGATFLIGIFTFLTVMFTDVPHFSPQAGLVAVLLYLITGAGWATLRWFTFLRAVKKFASAYTGNRKSFDTDIRYNFDLKSWPPAPRDKGAAIWFWFLYWPFDMLARLVGQPLKRIYQWLTSLFARMSARMFANVPAPDDK